MREVDTLLFMGGGELLWRYLSQVHCSHLTKVFLLSSKRHLDEVIDGEGTLRKLVSDMNISFVELELLTVSALEQLGLDFNKTLTLSICAAWIIKQDVIDFLGGYIYNVHGAKLPCDRGGAALSWQIMRGNAHGFVVVHQLDAGVDTGDIVGYRGFIYEGQHTPANFYAQYLKEALVLLDQTIPELLNGIEPVNLPQPSYLSTYWPRLNAELHGWVDWSWSGIDILRFISAFDSPYVGAHTLLGDRTVYFKDCSFDMSDGTFHPFQAGLIYRITEQYVAVCATTGSLFIKQVCNEKGALVPFSELKLGSRFFTPAEVLEQAQRTRVWYTPEGLREEKT